MILRLLLAPVLLTALLAAAEPALTIYNQNFGVIRDTVPIELHRGENQVTYRGTTVHLEPDSVILRDTARKVSIRILEQNYRSDTLTPEMLLSLFEGKTIDFLVQRGDRTEVVKGKVIRSGYVGGQWFNPSYSYGQPQQQPSPIIEVDGKLQFFLPGQPLFPALGNDTILKPSLNWIIQSDRDAKFDAELAYISGGLTWSADYNIVSTTGRETVDLIGWVTFQNQSGKTFENARIKLMAGDLNKIKPASLQPRRMDMAGAGIGAGIPQTPPVTEKTFDAYHLYTLERPATIHDSETKQVEFLRANQVDSQQLYIYDGFKQDNRYQGVERRDDPQRHELRNCFQQ